MVAPTQAPEEAEDSSQIRLRVLEGPEVGPLAAGSLYKVAIGVYTDTTLPRDVMQVTPHFRDQSGASTPAAVATQIAGSMTSYLGGPFSGFVKVYLEDFNPSAPHNPLAHVDFGTAANAIASSGPREIALCCSYYASQNTKRYRGRLYIPHAWIRVAGGGATTAPVARPTSPQIAQALGFGTGVCKPAASLGWQWCVASTVDKVGRVVTNYWVDDEWDVIRSRGFKGSTRQLATIP